MWGLAATGSHGGRIESDLSLYPATNKKKKDMKKIGLVMVMLATAVFASAQEKSADEYKNEGNAFVRSKDFASALASYKQALTLWGDSVDEATVFNAGMCAQKTKEYDQAYAYYAQSEQLGYKAAEAAYRMTQILKVQKKTDEYEAAIKAGYEKYPNGKTGSFFKKDYAKVIRDKAFKLYNEGAEITKAMQTAKADKVDDLKAEAKAKFEAALPIVDESLTINPDDANAKQIKDGIEKQIAALQ